MKTTFIFIEIAVLAAMTSAARGNPRALPFTYTTDTLVDGAVEIEQYVDLVPQRALTETHPTNPGEWLLQTGFQTELEIGIADRLELGLYFTFVPSPGPDYQGLGELPGVGNGIKQRLRYIFADPNEWPIDVGVYGELTELSNELEVEGKLLLQKRFGNLRIAANLSAEYEFYFSKERTLVPNPSLGATYEVSPKLHLGVDSFLRAEYQQYPKGEPSTFSHGPAAYVGPVVMMNFGKLWWSVGAYRRVTDFSHELVPGDSFGPYWVRSMLGYDL